MKPILMLALLIGAGNITARAQALIDDTAIQADVPHAFIVRDTTLPAGKYTIKRLDDTQPNVLQIRSDNGRTEVTFEVESAQAKRIPRKAELVFDKVGDQYFLSQIWASDSDIGYQLPKTKAQEGLEGSGMQTEHHSIFGKAFKRTKKAN
jgi:hypothetical protein